MELRISKPETSASSKRRGVKSTLAHPWIVPEWSTRLGGAKAVMGSGEREGVSSLRNDTHGRRMDRLCLVEFDR